MSTVWVVGSLNIDETVRVARHPTPGETVLSGPVQRRFGGKGANQAVAAAVAGAAVRMLGRVGADAGGRDYRARLEAFGIDVSGVLVDDEAPTGRAAIAIDDAGENTIIVSPGANTAVRETDLAPLEAIEVGDVLLVQLELDAAVVAAAIRVAAGRGARVVANLAPFAPLAVDALAAADPVVVNETEAAELEATGERPTSLLVTLGGAGSRWGEAVEPVAPVDEVIDTTGAGDTYCGALAAALARGEGRGSAMRVASRAAAACVAHHGAQPDPSDPMHPSR